MRRDRAESQTENFAVWSQRAVEALEPAARAYERRGDVDPQLALAPDCELEGQLSLDEGVVRAEGLS
jgi:hypothetical protein